jgi:hypothetical protein
MGDEEFGIATAGVLDMILSVESSQFDINADRQLRVLL